MPPELLTIVLNDIEKNLDNSLTAECLANQVGYSVYYFYRQFSAAVGMSLSAYILNRRLKKVLYEIASGKKAIDTAFLYGFDTYAGFYKAFVKEYGCSPKRYLAIYKNELNEKKEREILLMNLNKHEIKTVLNNWLIDPVTTIEKCSTINGIQQEKMVWKIGSDAFLHHTMDRNGELKNIAIAEALAKQGFASSIPIPTINGQSFVENKALLVLKKGIKGEPLTVDTIFQKELYPIAYGTAIAQLHHAFIELEGQILCDPSNLFETVKKWALPDVENQVKQWNLAIPEVFFNNYITIFSKLYTELPVQMIHRDPNFENILFLENKVNGFIDFDLVEQNIRLVDPCYCATSILSQMTSDHYDDWLPLLALILKGYDQINPLTKAEKSAVFYVICGIQMICVTYFGDRDNDDLTFKKLAKANRDMLEFIVRKQKEIERIFD
ncbi:helix-turn-helix domain-containing protein [Enterococcus rotai]|uniref:helix-turn-helix domain-containing protein n=1 Tax=Enterococcus rotai TaxID=118060 RepID=UPI0032B3FAF0